MLSSFLVQGVRSQGAHDVWVWFMVVQFIQDGVQARCDVVEQLVLDLVVPVPEGWDEWFGTGGSPTSGFEDRSSAA